MAKSNCCEPVEARQESRRVEIDGKPVALYLLDGEVFATHGICTHALAFLADGFVDGGTIECPLHQGIFDIRSGKALCSPVTQDLETYAVEVRDGEVFVDLDGNKKAAPKDQAEACTPRGAPSRGAVVVVGAGQAAAVAIRSMRASGFTGTINLVGREQHLPYERPPLSKDILLGKAAMNPAGVWLRPMLVLSTSRPISGAPLPGSIRPPGSRS